MYGDLAHLLNGCARPTLRFHLPENRRFPQRHKNHVPAFVPLHDDRSVGDGDVLAGDVWAIAQVRDGDDVRMGRLDHDSLARYNNRDS
jgi:hypothetical protein